MRVSLIVVASHGAGEWLDDMAGSCAEASAEFEAEIVVVNAGCDAAVLARVQCMASEVRVVIVSRRGDAAMPAAEAKDRGARSARGDVLVFLDAPGHPEPGAIEQLVHDVEFASSEGVEAIVTPRILTLDPLYWQNGWQPPGHLGFLDAETFDRGWQALPEKPDWYHFYASPVLLGGCLAMKSRLYEQLRGFDSALMIAGSEDLDLGLRSWQMGHPILHDPLAAVGFRLCAGFENPVAPKQVGADQIRLARKIFSDVSWNDWIGRYRASQRAGFWARAWALFEEQRASVEEERDVLLSQRVHDEFWYAAAFGLEWPPSSGLMTNPVASMFPPRPEPGSPRSFRNGKSGRACFEDHCRRPRNRGPLANANLLADLETESGERVALYLKLERLAGGELVIEQATFHGGDDPERLAYFSLLTEMVMGRPLGQVRALEPRVLQEVFEVNHEPRLPAEQAITLWRRALGRL